MTGDTAFNPNQPLSPSEEAAAQAAYYRMLAEHMGREVVGVSASLDHARTQATTDSLTGLPNRLGITQEIDALIQKGPGRFGVLFIDLDGLKEINDSLGHKAGDRFITRAANVLASGIRNGGKGEHADARESDIEGHMAARLSGDELVVIVKGVDNEEQLELVGARLRKKLENNGIAASLGAALHTEGESAADVISRADKAMYEIKQYRRELRQEEARDNLPQDLREFYDDIAVQIWEREGASEAEFHRIYGSGGR